MSEKTHQLLTMWRSALIAGVREKEPDLTMRQICLMLTVYETEGPHTVRGLAKALGVSKPVITRALNTLSRYGYVKRTPDEKDRRSIFIARTVKGSVYLSELSDRVLKAEQSSFEAHPGAVGAKY